MHIIENEKISGFEELEKILLEVYKEKFEQK